ncbi:MAG: hypothetical protein WCH31_06835 [Actinomycetes bacterium]
MSSAALDGFSLVKTTVLAEARAAIAAGREPDETSLQARLQGAASKARSDADLAEVAEIDQAERAAAEQLDRVIGVYRARRRLAGDAPPPATPAPVAPRPSLRSSLRTKPTITGNMDVRRSESDSTALEWDAVAGIADWEIRFSERPRPGAEYVALETLTLPAATTSVAVPIGENVFRINILGRARDGRPKSRALIAGLTKDSWRDRWERKATAS